MADNETPDASALVTRLRSAEKVCLLFGWGGDLPDSERGRACAQAWHEWAELVGSEYTSTAIHPHLTDEYITELARKRDETRARTLGRLGLVET